MDFDLQGLMKQAQEMQQKMQQAQEDAAKEEVVGESGAGLVKVTMNGRHDVRGVDIDSSPFSEVDRATADDCASLHSFM